MNAKQPTVADRLVEYAQARVAVLQTGKDVRTTIQALRDQITSAHALNKEIKRRRDRLVELTNFLQKHLFTDAAGVTGSLDRAAGELDAALDDANRLIANLAAPGTDGLEPPQPLPPHEAAAEAVVNASAPFNE